MKEWGKTLTVRELMEQMAFLRFLYWGHALDMRGYHDRVTSLCMFYMGDKP